MPILLGNGTTVTNDEYRMSRMTKKERKRYQFRKNLESKRKLEVQERDEIVLAELRANGIL